MAILLNSAVWAGITISRTYLDLLLLSTYPTSWLPFFFLGQTVVVLIITAAITPLSSKGSSRVNFSLFLTAALSILAGALMLDAPIPGFKFGFSLWLAAIPVILIVISLNAIADAFDMRKFKRLVIWISVAGNTGGLLMGLFIPLIIAKSHTEVLLYILVGLISFAAFCLFFLPPLPVPAKKTAQAQSPFNYPLFRTVAICTFLLMLIDTFADYALKAELGATFSNKDDIGKFMGPFYGISNVLMLSLQVVGTQYLLKVAGILGLLTIIPWYCGISSISMIIYPGLITATLLRLGQTSFRFSFFSVGREIALKPLPAQIRRMGKFHITTVGYLGAGLASILLWLFVEKLELPALPVLIFITGVLWIIVARRVTEEYQGTLEEAIRIKRFGMITDEPLTDGHQDTNALNVMAFAFLEKEPDTVRFGFTLLGKYHLDKLPKEAYPHLDSEYFDIRVSFVSAACRLRDKSVAPLLLKRLTVEQDGKVTWEIMKTLIVLDPDAVVSCAAGLLEAPDPLTRAGSVVILLMHGTLDELIAAGTTLKAMIANSDPAMRKGAAYAISALRIGKFETELSALLRDPEETVSIAAMWAISGQRNPNLIGILAARMGRGRVSRYASRTLIKIGEPALPHVMNVIKSGQATATRAAVRVLTAIQGEDTDHAIVEAAKIADITTRTSLAKMCSLRTKQRPNSNFLVQQAREFVIAEAESIRILKAAKNLTSLSEHASCEIAHRQQMAEARLLYWFDVCTQSAELIGVIPTLLQQNTSQAIALRHATALEFLETQTNDKALKKAIAIFEEQPQAAETEQAISKLRALNDAWLTQVLDAEQAHLSGEKMDITAKVMLLRKVKLFAELPGEVLLTIAETCEDREMVLGEKLFSMGDAPDGMYIIASGNVDIEREGTVLKDLHQYDFFGEIGLFDDSPRLADAIAKTDGMTLFLEKEVFDGITEDLPEVLRALVRTVIGYLK
ncbi:MAG: cyclic nucleotide-binding domain-containing protein [Gammaproteobacteria bacterium]|nr:cyclic nucleotide-binding domain-containing protein [Gammaproteobacteria bacterium]